MRRPFRTVGTIALAVAAPASIRPAAAQAAPAASPSDTLPRRVTSINNRLQLDIGTLAAIQISTAFTYVGGQRFILGGTADAEQHLFVVADSTKNVLRLFWIQAETLLPTRVGSYNYTADSTVMVQGFPLAASTRTYTAAPDPTSDRARAFALVQARGFRVPDGAIRVRLVYLPEQPARRELMIVYLEVSPSTKEEVRPQDTLLKKVASGLVLQRSP